MWKIKPVGHYLHLKSLKSKYFGWRHWTHVEFWFEKYPNDWSHVQSCLAGSKIELVPHDTQILSVLLK